jgi:hypothetical protein
MRLLEHRDLQIVVVLLFIMNRWNESTDKTYIYECRYDERLKTNTEESTHLAYTGLFGELEHLKIETRIIDEMFASVMGEYVFLKPSNRRPINI